MKCDKVISIFLFLQYEKILTNDEKKKIKK